MLRNLTPVVAPVAALNNVMLPLWMLTLGLVLVAQGRAVTTRVPDRPERKGAKR